MATKILIINSDSPYNRGDRAILAGNLQLIRSLWPEAEIHTLSEEYERDQTWYEGVTFLPYSANTTNLLHIFQVAKFSKGCDLVFWGGGEILKDYTNKLNPIYWTVRMVPIWLVNKNIYGLLQGIGPTRSRFSQKLIAFLVNRTRHFLVRDEQSKEKLVAWGAKTPITTSYDPAILTQAAALDTTTRHLLAEQFNVSPEFLENSVAIGLRRWFHYKHSGIIPFKFRFWEKKHQQDNPDMQRYIAHVAKLCDYIVETHDMNITFFPMYLTGSENDHGFSLEVRSSMKHKDRTRIIDKDILSPQQYLDTLGSTKVTLSARMHPSILATSSGVPTAVFYYVDKGRLYFDQIGMQRFSQPIESLLEVANLARLQQQIDTLITTRPAIQKELDTNLAPMRRALYKDFAAVFAKPKDRS